MRLYEILLAFSCFALLISTLFTHKLPRLNGIVASTISMSILTLHLWQEGYRWQMFGVYSLTIVVTGSLCWKSIRSSSTFNLWKSVRYTLFGLSCVVITLTVLLSSCLPVFQLPKLEGPYQVGTFAMSLTDEGREEIYTENGGDKRKILVQFWYPAQVDNVQKTVPVFPEDPKMLASYKKGLSSFIRLPEPIFDYWKYIRSNAYEEAAVQPTSVPYPLIIINHGMGTTRLLHVSQAEQLASHGYIVTSIDHPYSTVATAFSDGTNTDYRTTFNMDNFYTVGKSIGTVWTEDVNFVIRQLDGLNTGHMPSPLTGAINMDKIGVMGHSFGGATAFNVLNTNPRVKAAVNMDGSLYELDINRLADKPALFLKADKFTEMKEQQRKGLITDTKMSSIIAQELAIMEKVKQHGGSIIQLEGAKHYNFTDLQLYSNLLQYAGITGTIYGYRGSSVVNHYVLDFFNKNLKGTGGALMKGASSEYPEVTFH